MATCIHSFYFNICNRAFNISQWMPYILKYWKPCYICWNKKSEYKCNRAFNISEYFRIKYSLKYWKPCYIRWNKKSEYIYNRAFNISEWMPYILKYWKPCYICIHSFYFNIRSRAFNISECMASIDISQSIKFKMMWKKASHPPWFELSNYISRSIIILIKPRYMSLGGYVARMGRREMYIDYWWQNQKQRGH
jgi:hypothetical protein